MNPAAPNRKAFFIGLGILAILAIFSLVILTNCSRAAQPTPPPIVGPVWKWRNSQFNNGVSQIVPDPNQYTIQFTADGVVNVQADCNTGSGSYTLNGSTLKISDLRMTLAACPPDSLAPAFLQELQSVSSYLLSGADLVLNIQDNSGRMIFTSEAIAGVPTTTAATPTLVSVVTVTPIQQTATPIQQTATRAPATATAVKTLPPACPGLPQIEFFRAEPQTIVRGANTVLRWGKVTNATQVAIDQGVGGVPTPGSLIVAPVVTTTYTLTATGCGGTAQTVTQVIVNQPTGQPPTQAPTQAPTQQPTSVPPTATPKPTQEPPTATPKPTQEPPTATPKPTEKPGADLIGITWRWTGLVAPAGAENPPDPSKYTIVFNADNSLAIRADCNTGGGTYTLNGNAITIHLGVMTTIACESDSLANEYLSLLPQATAYHVQNNTLTLTLAQNQGTMTFTR